uniref:Teleost multiple tissue opsin 3b n=1 Tax=Amphilophus citrinellus TaxID=61819 RepID=A0A3Q0T1Q9_AMPCI
MMIHLQHSNFSTEQSPGALSRAGHTAAAVFLGFILVLGFLGNFLVLLVFSCFSVLRILANLLLVNISVSDMLVCIFGTPLSFTASVRGRWLTGSYGCQWYGFCNALFVIVSLVSLSLLSFERYSVLLCKLQSDSCQYRRAWLAVAASWLYALVWTLPPLLGWSRSSVIYKITNPYDYQKRVFKVKYFVFFIMFSAVVCTACCILPIRSKNEKR